MLHEVRAYEPMKVLLDGYEKNRENELEIYALYRMACIAEHTAYYTKEDEK